jgi:hypothetical protein
MALKVTPTKSSISALTSDCRTSSPRFSVSLSSSQGSFGTFSGDLSAGTPDRGAVELIGTRRFPLAGLAMIAHALVIPYSAPTTTRI